MTTNKIINNWEHLLKGAESERGKNSISLYPVNFDIVNKHSHMVQWLGQLALTQQARVRFPVWEHKFFLTWPLTFFNFKHLHYAIFLSTVNIFSIFLPKFCRNRSPAFDPQFSVPEVLLLKGHQKLNCRRKQTSFFPNQVFFHNVCGVYL